MNINSAVSFSSICSVVQSKKIDIERSAIASGKSGDVKTVAAGAAPETLEEADKIEHYEYEEKPWMSYEEYDPSLSESNNKCLYTIKTYLDSIGQLKALTRKFEQFIDHVKDLRPDIASTGFSFTLDENAKIKILARPLGFSESDMHWLTEEINSFEGLRATAHAHSKTLMALVDHFEPFKGKYNLNRHNFQSTVYYGDNLKVSWMDLQRKFMETLAQSLEKKPQTLIDTYA
ncbi:hypothetical protein [Pseudomonas sp. DWP3-1-2]|uniref:hypothetical protein n=1 Tax=Pseudomonas sp. DWP3-1-2 TaxID=2804645 RepID=UPI003CE7C06F